MTAQAVEFGAAPVVKLGGAPLTGDLKDRLVAVVVDLHRMLPDMLELRWRDPHQDLLTAAHFALATPVTVSGNAVGETAQVALFDGEITSLESVFDGTGSYAVVRAYDKAHRMSRQPRTETYTNKTDADIARAIIGRNGLTAGQIDATSLAHPWLGQVNTTDWDFLQERARAIGYECTTVLGKLAFRRPPTTSGAAVALVLGQNLHEIRPRVTAVAQPTGVTVRGWTPQTKQSAVGQVRPADGHASVQLTANAGSVFGAAPYTAVDKHSESAGEARLRATGVTERLASARVEAEGRCEGSPKLTPGSVVELANCGWPYQGKYLLTRTRHSYDPLGYRVDFEVSGGQDRSLLRLVNPGRAGAGDSHPVMSGVVVGIVTDNKDPDKQGRVKVRFPWLDEKFTSHWARLAQIGAGATRGALVVPEVNDEVLVAFSHGDVRAAYVIGGLYNGRDKPAISDAVDAGSGAVNKRAFYSRTGHYIVFDDSLASPGITIKNGKGTVSIVLDEKNSTIAITGTKAVTVDATDITVTGKKSITMKAPQVAIEAQMMLSMKSDAQAELAANAVLSLKGTAALNATGGIIKLN